MLIDIEDFVYSKNIRISYQKRRGKILIDRVLVYSEFNQSFGSTKKKKKQKLFEYGVKVAFIIPYSIYGGAEVYLKNIFRKQLL